MEQNKIDGLPEGWEKNELWKLLKVQNWYAFDAVNFNDTEGFPLIRIRDLKNSSTQLRYKWDWDEKFKVSDGDLLIWMDWEFRCYEWKGGHALLNQRVCRLQEVNPRLSRKFLLYWINSHLQEIEEKTAFVTVKHISSKQINSIQFPLPPLAEQERIVAKLDGVFEHVDASIKLLEQNIADADSMAESVLNEAFNANSSSEKWGIVKIKDACVLVTDWSHFSPKTQESGRPYISVKDITESWEIDLARSKRISNEDYEILRKNGCEPIEGDVLLSKDGTVGKVAIVQGYENFVVLSSLAILRPGPNLLPEYFAKVMISPAFQDTAIWLKSGAAIKRIVLRTIKEIEFPLPPFPEQERIVAKLDAFFTVQKIIKSGYEAKISELKALKSSILSSAFRGEI